MVDSSDKRRALLDLLLQQERSERPSTTRLSRRTTTGPVPLSFSQERLWFLDHFHHGSPLYNLPSAYPLVGQLDVEAVRASLTEIVRRHEILRTSFSVVGEKPVQVVSADPTIEVPLADLQSLPDAERLDAANTIMQTEAMHTFDLAKGPLLRASLIRLADDQHILFLVMHHIVSDAWSMEILAREFNALYESFARQVPVQLPNLPIQYQDYSAWQREWVAGEGFQRQLAYWKDRLADIADTPIELPVDRPRPAALTLRGATRSFSYSTELSAAVRRLAAAHGTTLFMTLLAGLNVVLHRYSGAPRVVVGFPTASRSRTEVENLIGFFVNTLVLTTEIAPQTTSGEYLHQVKEAVIGALNNQDVPFERLVEELAPTRNINANPLFQVMFDFKSRTGDAATAPPETAGSGSFGWADAGVGTGMAKFDLTVVMGDVGDQLGGSVEYSVDLFDESTVQRLIGHLGTVLEAMAANDAALICTLPMLSPGERHQVVVEWNDNATTYPGLCLHEGFEQQARRTPDAIAAVSDGNQLTYRQLNSVANRVAGLLRQRSVGPEVVVGICMDASLDLVVAVLAVLKAGGAYLPLDPGYPHERLRFMVEDADVQLILTEQRLVELAEALRRPVEPIYTTGASTEDDVDNLANLAMGSHTCYVMYTSGSTGRPKAVVVEHRGVVNFVLHVAERLGVRQGSQVLQFTSFSFDISAIEIFTALFSGATLHLQPREAMDPGQPLARILNEHQISHLMAVPSVLSQLPDVPLPHLTSIMAGGEPCPGNLVRRLAMGRRFFNGYGPTEISIASSMTPCQPSGEKPTIGRPIPNVTFHVVDKNLQPCAIGQVGELLIGGAGVARGYLGRPALTAQCFIPDPFAGAPGARAYRTGDLARRLPNGEVDYLGRIDSQVKVRGHRIELGEIESVLSEHPDVDTAVVTCARDARGDNRLTAHVVAATSATISTEILRRHVGARLPHYMIPQSFTVLAALPLTAGGKLDLQALASADTTTAQLPAYVAPRNCLEQVLADVWREVLQVDRIGVHDNFFELGGHSLLVTQTASRLRDRLDLDMPVRVVFEAPTVAELALALTDAQTETELEAAAQLYLRVAAPTTTQIDVPDQPDNPGAHRARGVSEIVPRATGGPAPLSFAQERLWFLEQLEPNTSRYNVLLPIHMPGIVDVAALERALGEIVQRHDVLRTLFHVEDGHPVQVVVPAITVPLPVTDLRVVAEADRQAHAAAKINEDSIQPFNLAEAPLLRARLLLLGNDQNVLVLVLHHAISDAWSMQLLRKELNILYDTFRAGRVSPLTRLSVQYRDYAVWQRNRLQGDVLDNLVTYWREQLRDAPLSLDLPLDRPRPPTDMLHSSTEIFWLPAELCARLEQLVRPERATPYMAFCAVLNALLYRITGQNKIIIGSPMAGRHRVELEPLIGLFTNTLVLCTDIHGQLTFTSLLRRVRDVALGAYAHQELPFERLVEEINPERNLTINPIFQVMFAYQGEPGPLSQQRTQHKDANLEVAGDGATARFELMLYLERSPDGATGAFEYATELFDRSTIRRLVSSFCSLLESAVENPDQQIRWLQHLSKSQSHQLLAEWSGRQFADLAGADGSSPSTPNTTVHELVSAQAERIPDAVAVVSGGQQWTYAELTSLSETVASHLIAAGVGPETCVAVLMGRGIELLATLLGILKAGGVYLPLDKGLPAQRLAFIVADADVSIVVSTTNSKAQAAAIGNVTVLGIDEILAAPAPTAVTAHELKSGADSPAYVIYTSGSTGTPKGVVVAHRTLTGLLRPECDAQRPHPARTLQFSSPSFDVSLQEIFSTWLQGSTLVCAAEEDLHEFSRLIDVIDGHKIERLFMPFVALQHLAEAAQGRTTKLRSLKQVITAGEQLKVTPALRSLFENLRGCRLVNQYGPSETHVVSEHRLGPNPWSWSPLPPIGRPVAGATLYVLDQSLQPVGVGHAGELYIGGTGLARGYLRRPGLTAAKLVPDPFTSKPGGRLYRTGDRVRYHGDGNLEFLGRADQQVKVRGFRVEPGEIEVCLARHRGVGQAVVVGQPGPSGDVELIAYIVPSAAVTPDVPELLELLRRHLPNYMIPSRFIVSAELELTPTGKLDRRRLPAPGPAQRRLNQQFLAPRTPLEERIAQTWQEVLGTDHVGVQDSFFELGGHSLLATQLISRLRTRLGVEIPLRRVFEAPTVEGMALATVELLSQLAPTPDVSAVLDEIEGLSDDDVDLLVARTPEEGLAVSARDRAGEDTA
jgi:amino acid adenylation domain-containing protein